MPIYEYACRDCGDSFEALVRSDTTVQCPKCHSEQLDKLLSVFATTAGSESRMAELPAACGSCGHPGGPGACAFSQ